MWRLTGIIVLLIFIWSCQPTSSTRDFPEYTYSIPAYGNSWVPDEPEKTEEMIGESGICNWNENDIKIRTYFKTEETGKIDVGLVVNAKNASTLTVSLGDKLTKIKIAGAGQDTVAVGTFEITEPGYHFVELQGADKNGASFPDVQAVLIGGPATDKKVWFVNDDFYWGRRGPSVHLSFQVPDDAGDVVYFYNEITVPEQNDVIGSYFMANGFANGYFGIQVNSPAERRVLFSVWSPFNTDNPNEIPKDKRIVLLKKGEDVHAGEFGDEGSGGQSYFRFMWKAGTTYRFLLKGQPAGNNKTDFTAWFFAPELGEWKLIASFRRPETDTYLTRLYSFLENFYPEYGDHTRRAYYSNQWIYTTNNKWVELNRIKFTADATARKESRMDYAGGAEGEKFYLQNCGFFSQTTTVDTYFERELTGKTPEIYFNSLP